MIPVSTVNASNYHLLGNQLKGESHAKRMKRVHAAANLNAMPSTLQPLGAMADSINQISGPLFLAVVAGAVVGKIRPGGNGRKSLLFSAAAGGIAGAVLTAIHPEFNSSQGDNLGQLVVLGVLGSVAASVSHGLSRGSKNWLKI